MNVEPSRLRIIHHPDPVLRRTAAPLGAVTAEVRAVALRMLDLMHEAPGVGLAAPQVGLSWRLFVANVTKDRAQDQVFINPVLSDPSKETDDYEEGCLSLPGVEGVVRRPRAVRIQALDLQGQPFTLMAEDLRARVWQHEFDHLQGILIIDRMSPVDRLANQRALRDMEEALR